MTPPAHAGVSLAIGGMVGLLTRSPGAVAAALAVGVLMDLDHLPDYYRLLVLRRSDRLWVALHSYEWVVPGLLAVFLSGWNPLALAALLAFLAHLLCDQWANPVHPLGYFFTFRALKGFQTREIAPAFSLEEAEQELMALPLARRVVPWLLQRLQALHQGQRTGRGL